MGMIRAFIFFTVFSICAGCAPLPDVSKITAEYPSSQAPKILSSKGLLSREKSKAIMERLQRSVKSTDLLQRHEAVLETATGAHLVKGNKVTLLVDGRSAYAAIFRAVDAAKVSINLETYKIEDDEVGRKLADMLRKKSAEGVVVNLMYDGIGSLLTSASFFQQLRDAGIRVVAVGPSKRADHRKMLIIDGKVLITGGINISHVYSSTPFPKEKQEKRQIPWRDTDVQIEGPVVAEFQKLFLDLWLKQGGPALTERELFPKLNEQGDALVRAIANTPGEKNRAIYLSYVAALLFAEHSIHLTNAYFIPDDRTLDALTDAAKRGVDVKIVLPSVSDSSLALNAARYNYTELLKAGVKLYERRKALLHAKTAVIDGVWSTVGSSNLDFLSLSNNYEVNAVILGRGFATEMENLFQKDLAESEQIRLEKWKKRSILEKTKELFAHMLSHML